MEIHEKIKKARLDSNMSQINFAKHLGVHQHDVSKMEKGQKKFIPQPYINFLIDQGYDLNSIFDNDRSVEKLKNVSIAETTGVYQLRTDFLIENQTIPLYQLEATAGLVELLNNKNDLKPIDHLFIPNLPRTDGAIRVQGDSMYPLLKSGDIVIFKEHSNNLEDIFFGEMYLISLKIDHDELVMVKWLQRSEHEEYVKLVSENRHHQPKEVHISKITALALIKASVRINSM